MRFRFPRVQIESGVWTQTQISEDFGGNCRDGASLIALPSGRLVFIGGWYTGIVGPDPSPVTAWDSLPTTNEVWTSDDSGATWTLALAHDSNPPTEGAGARFQRGHTVPTLVHRVSGTDYVFRIGGDIYVRAPGHVWRAPVSGGGVTGWERVTTSGPTAPLNPLTEDATVLHAACSFNGYIYVVGGQPDVADDATAHARVYRSADGVTWEQRTDAPFTGRGTHAMCVHNGRLVVLCGMQYASLTYLDDVWSMGTDETWTEELASGHGQFLPRGYPWAASAGGRLWLGGGGVSGDKGTEGTTAGYGDSDNLRSIFYSTDSGPNWTRWDDAIWNGSHADGVTTYGSAIYRVTGNRMDHATYRIART